MYHTFKKKKTEWKRSGGSVHIFKDCQYNSRMKFFNKVGWTFNVLKLFWKLLIASISTQ